MLSQFYGTYGMKCSNVVSSSYAYSEIISYIQWVTREKIYNRDEGHGKITR